MIIMLALVWTHFVADFILQSDDMAKNKSKSNYWLSMHVAVYALPFLLFGWKFAIVNGIAHWLVDWWTSRINSHLWSKGKVHAFFVGVGADQAIHMTTLLVTARVMGVA